MKASFEIHPSPKLAGDITLPGDKSLSHRALLFAALAEGESRIKNLLEGEDVLCTLAILRELGVHIEKVGEEYVVHGRGLGGLRAPTKILYCGNSGTTLRLLTGLLAGCPFPAMLTGDASLNRRPMGRVLGPLREMGAELREEHRGGERFIHVNESGGRRKLRGLAYRSPVASAQLKAALLLAGLQADGSTEIIEPQRSRDHTERMLTALGADLAAHGARVTLRPGKPLQAFTFTVPGDISSAAFFLVAGLISPDPATSLTLRQVGVNPTRTGLLDALASMSAAIAKSGGGESLGEPVADLTVTPHRPAGAGSHGS